MALLFFVILFLILILLIAEYVAHDCKPGKECTHKCELPNINDSPESYIDKLRKMVQNSYEYVAWRSAVLVALIVLIPIHVI